MILLLFACVATLLLTPLTSNTLVPIKLDYLNHISAIIQANKALSAWQIPLRTETIPSNGWLYPLFQFYSPTSYMIAGLIYRWITPNNPFIAYKLFIWFMLIFSGFYIYQLTMWLFRFRAAAILASIVYMTTPYFSIIINNIGAFNEVIALGLLPCVLYYSIQQYYSPTLKFLLISAMTWYLLATTHLITFLSTTFFVFLLLGLITIINHSWRNFFFALLAFVIGCLMAGWFLIPIILFSKYLMIKNSFINLDSFYELSPRLIHLLAVKAKIYYVNSLQDINIQSISLVRPNIGLPILMSFSISLYVISTRKTLDNSFVMYLFVLFIIAFILTWSPINFWQWLPDSFRILQYSWRLLGQISWIGSLLFAWSLAWLFQSKLQRQHILMGIFLICLYSTANLSFFKETYVNYANSLKTTTLNNTDYLIDTKKYSETKTNLNNTLQIKQVQSHCQTDNMRTICTLKVPTNIKKIELPVYYYPQLLYITLNGKSIPYTYSRYKNHLIPTITPLTNRENVVEITFQGLVWANKLSTMIWIIFILLSNYLVIREIASRIISKQPLPSSS